MKINVKVYLQGRLVRNDGNGVLFSENSYGRREVLIEPAHDPKRWSLSPPPSRPEGYSQAMNWNEKVLEPWREKTIGEALYQSEMERVLEGQKTEPYFIERLKCVYQDRIYTIDYESAHGLDPDELAMTVKHAAISHAQQFKRIQKEIKAFENLEKLTHRELIPESVRIFVWQRDEGRCVECHRRDSLEFDHIIPIAEGGSSTERNVQLLCATCNRSKGKKV